MIEKCDFILSPKQKAEELLLRFSILPSGNNDLVKKLAKLSVVEILEFMQKDDELSGTCSNANSEWIEYWLNVIAEIDEC